jgi:hypothetical protein
MTMQTAARKLNQLLADDPSAVSDLLSLRVHARAVAKRHPTFIPAVAGEDVPVMGLLEVISWMADEPEVLVPRKDGRGTIVGVAVEERERAVCK